MFEGFTKMFGGASSPENGNLGGTHVAIPEDSGEIGADDLDVLNVDAVAERLRALLVENTIHPSPEGDNAEIREAIQQLAGMEGGEDRLAALDKEFNTPTQ